MGESKHSLVDGDGLIIFQDVSQAIKAEKTLRNAGFHIKLVAPPARFRRGCDLGLEINLVEKVGISRLLKDKNVDYVDILSTNEGSLELLSVVRTTDYGQWLMVKAGNMKLVYDKANAIIVNTSGGGCPDIPYLHAEMVGKTLTAAPKPTDLGYTLCAIMLDRALEEALIIWNGGNDQ